MSRVLDRPSRRAGFGFRAIGYVIGMLVASFGVTMLVPFALDLFLGNGHGVELRLNQNDVDLSGRIRDDNTVRIQAGG